MRSALAVFASMLFVAVPASSSAHPRIEIVDLGQLGNASAGQGQATSVNVFGEVVGDSCDPEPDHCRAFRWTRATGMVDLGSLGGAVARAIKVTPFGSVLGYGTTSRGAYRPFRWTRCGGVAPLDGDEVFGGPITMPNAASDWGQVVGSGFLGDGVTLHAFSWTPRDGMVDLGTLGGTYSTAKGVANRGQVVGSSTTADGSLHAFLWTREAGMVDLGTLGGTWSDAFAVNARGQVVGSSTTPDAGAAQRAFSWTAAGGMIDLGNIGGVDAFALRVNDRGEVVGTSGGGGGFYWSPGEGMIDLGSLGDGGTYPSAIGPTGQVVGTSRVVDATSPPGSRRLHAFSWTRRGGMIDLGTLPGGSESIAIDVGPDGIVVGTSTTSTPGEWRPVLWRIR